MYIVFVYEDLVCYLFGRIHAAEVVAQHNRAIQLRFE